MRNRYVESRRKEEEDDWKPVYDQICKREGDENVGKGRRLSE